jgi:hypothetical protein
MRLALGGGFHVAVEQHDRNAGLRGHIGDARAHEAGADTPILRNLVGLMPSGRRAPLLSSCSETNSERIIDSGFRSSAALAEIALLDLQPVSNGT